MATVAQNQNIYLRYKPFYYDEMSPKSTYYMPYNFFKTLQHSTESVEQPRLVIIVLVHENGAHWLRLHAIKLAQSLCPSICVARTKATRVHFWNENQWSSATFTLLLHLASSVYLLLVSKTIFLTDFFWLWSTKERTMERERANKERLFEKFQVIPLCGIFSLCSYVHIFFLLWFFVLSFAPLFVCVRLFTYNHAPSVLRDFLSICYLSTYNACFSRW